MINCILRNIAGIEMRLRSGADQQYIAGQTFGRYSRYTAIGGALSFGALCFGSRSSSVVFVAKIVTAVVTAFGLLGMYFVRILQNRLAAAWEVVQRNDGERPPERPRIPDAAPPPARPRARLAEQTIALDNQSKIIVRPMLDGCNPSESRFFDISQYKNAPILQHELNAHLESPSALFNQQGGLDQPARFLFVRLSSSEHVDTVVTAVKGYLSRPDCVAKTVTILVQLPKS